MKSNPHSTAAIVGHPLHPLLITLPIGLFVFTLLSDIASWGTGDMFWAKASLWLVGAGFFSAIVAALAGLVDFIGSAGIRKLSEAWMHFLGSAVVMLLAATSSYLRLNDITDGVSTAQILLSFCIVVLLAVTGWLGGEIVFRRRVAVDDGAATPTPDEQTGTPPAPGRAFRNYR